MPKHQPQQAAVAGLVAGALGGGSQLLDFGGYEVFAVGVMENASQVLCPVIPVSLSGPPVQWSSPAARFAPLTAPDPAAAD
jgi:hypothetical protein